MLNEFEYYSVCTLWLIKQSQNIRSSVSECELNAMRLRTLWMRGAQEAVMSML